MDLSHQSACFLGPGSENYHLLEELILDYVRDHCFWRRNFHPEDRSPISSGDKHSPEYIEFVDRMREELSALSAELKKAVPFFSPRYLGHMSSDILLPAFIARVVTTLYNPNNVSEDASPVTLEKELQAGTQLATMFGMPTDESQEPCAWGHLTSGGTVANYEALWNLRAVKFYPIALAEAVRSMGLQLPISASLGKSLVEATKWELVNLTVDESISLRRETASAAKDALDLDQLREFAKAVRSERIEALGTADFFLKHSEIKPPSVLVPASGHYSWEKAMKVMGFGTRQLVKVPVDSHMRLDTVAFRSIVEREKQNGRPILAAIAVLGTTEFGTVDPVHEVLQIRDDCRKNGFDFGVHVDAAWGGYLSSLFRREDGSLHTHEEMRQKFTYFPSERVYGAFAALGDVDSITVDPHKLGYVPYAAGAFVCRNREVVDFVTQKAAYVFDLGDSEKAITTGEKLRNLGQYVLEGSKAGAAAASVYVTHKVLPLHSKGFGRILEHTIRATEVLHGIVLDRRKGLADKATITIPFVTDTNLLCFAVNPKGNTSLSVMNRFNRALFDDLKVSPDQPIQMREYIGSYTSLLKDNVPKDEADRILKELHIDKSTFSSNPHAGEKAADHIFLLRHTLMNPWLLSEANGQNWLERYWDYLEARIETLLSDSATS